MISKYFNILTLLFIWVSVVYSQITTPYRINPNNNHTYFWRTIPEVGNGYPSTLTFINGLTYKSAHVYLATITSPEELAFVQNVMMNDVKQYTYNLMVSGIRTGETFSYNSGKENSDLIYVGSLARCYTVCPWMEGYPSTVATSNYIAIKNVSGTVQMYNVDYASSALYLLEVGGITEPYLPPPTTAGGNVNIRNLVQQEVTNKVWDINSIAVTITTKSGLVYQPSITSRLPTSITVNLNPGIEPFSLFLIDSNNFNYTSNINYQAPFVQTIYSNSQTVGSIITLYGSNFYTTSNNIAVFTGTQKNPCTDVSVLIPHQAVTCKLSVSSNGNSITVLPLSIDTGYNLVYPNKRIPFYDPSNVRVIRIADVTIPDEFGVVQSIISSSKPVTIDTNVAYQGVVTSLAQGTHMINMFNFDNKAVFQGIKGNKISNLGGPNDNVVVFPSTFVCNSSLMYCGTTNKIGYNTVYITFYQNNSVPDIGSFSWVKSGELVFYGIDPLNYTTPQSFLLDTTGGQISVLNRGSNGFALTNRKFNYQGSTYTSISQFNCTTMILQVPAGTGLNNPLSINIENKFSLSSISINYKPPTISNILPRSSSFGGPITVYGTQFGPTVSGISASINMGSTEWPCINIEMYIPHEAIICTLPSGHGTNLQFTIIVNTQSASYQYSYSEPIILNITQSITTLTIVGTGFGFDTQFIETYPSTSELELTTSKDPQTYIVDAPINTKNGPFVVTANGQSSLPYDFYFKPNISSTNPSPSTTQSTLLTINGAFLNTQRQNGSSVLMSIALDNGLYSCISPSGNTGASLTCTIPAFTGSHYLIISADGQISNNFTLNAASPSITNINQVKSSLTLIGSNFGLDKSKISVKIGSVLIRADSVDSTGSTVACTLPSNLQSGPISIIVDGLPSQSLPFKLTPVILSVSGTNTTGGLIIISGNFFNNIDQSGTTLITSVTVGGVQCSNALITIDNTEIQCIAPSGSGVDIPIQVSIDTKVGQNLFNYLPPFISSITQNPTFSQITIQGFNFGQTTATIIFCQTQLQFTSLNDTLIIANIPSSMKNDFISITISSQLSNSLYFKLTPIILSLNSPPTIGGNVIIRGTFLNKLNFAGESLNVQVKFDNGVCDNASSDGSQITCMAPSGSGLNRNVVVSIDGVSSGEFTFAYQSPTINLFTQKDMIGVVNATNIGIDPKKITASFISLKSIASRIISLSPESFEVDIPPFSLNGELSIQVDGQYSNSISYQLTPVLLSVTSAPVSGGIITIDGHFLNTINGNNTQTTISVILLPNTECTGINKLADDDLSHLTCTLPPGLESNLTLQVTINGLSDTITYSYGAPTIKSITINENNQINITGENMFGPNFNTIVNWGHETTFSQFENGTTDTSIIIQIPNNYLNDYVSVTLNGRTSNAIQVKLYPIINGVTSSRTIGSNITITGNFLNSFRADHTQTQFLVSIDGQPCQVFSDNSQTSKIVLVPSGTGQNLPLTVTIDGQPDTILYSYQAPTTNGTIIQLGSMVTIYGDNFGNDLSVVQAPVGMTKVSVFHNQLVFQLPNTYQSGLISFTIDGQQAETYFYITPILSSFTNQYATGGNITISGQYFNNKRSDSTPTSIEITVGSETCSFQTTNSDNAIICTLGSKSIYQGIITVSIDSKSGILLTTLYDSLPPIISSASSIYYQVPETLTIYGSYFVSPISAQIGGLQCTNPQLLDSNRLTCIFNASVKDSNRGLTVIVNNDQISGSNNVFLYAIDCSGKCNNGGHCQNGYCICSTGFSGSYCDISVNNTVIPTINPSSVQFPLYNNVTFYSGIVALVEVDINNNIIKQLVLDGSWISVPNKVNTYLYSNSGVNVTIETKQFTQNNFTYYAGETIPVSVGTVKHTVTIKGWKFAKSSNVLQIVYHGTSPSQFNYNCQSTKPTIITNDNSFIIDSPLGILFAQFSGRSVADTSIYKTPITKLNFGNSTIRFSINTPFFQDELVYDPTFISYYKPDVIIGCVTPTPTSTPTTSTTDSTTSISNATLLTPFSKLTFLFILFFMHITKNFLNQ